MANINMAESTGALAAGAINVALKYMDQKAATPRTALWSRWQDWGKVVYPVLGVAGVMTNTMTQMSNGMYLAGIPMLLELLTDATGLTTTIATRMGSYVQTARPQARYVSPVQSAPVSSPVASRVGYVPGGLPERPQLGR